VSRLLSAALAAAVLAAPASTRAADPPTTDNRPPALREVAFDQRLGEKLPLETAFRDESGRTVKLGDYFGKRPVILTLAYYECPMLCTLTLNGLVGSLSVLSLEPGRDFEIVTISFEPKETPELAAQKKKAYIARYRRPEAAAAWHFLTGSPESIKAVTSAAGFKYVWDESTHQYAHASGIMVTTPDGRLSRYLYGIEYAPKDLRFALVESSEGRIGNPVDQLLLYCYHYDPSTGKYGLMVMNVLKMAASVTVMALAGLVFILHRRERALAPATASPAVSSRVN
jgi:protein SCO1/2